MEPLKDPKKNRVIKEVILPVHRPLTEELLYGTDGNPLWKNVINHFKREGKLSKKNIIELIQKVAQIFRKEPNLLEIDDPITVVGDIHGQFFDLLKILEVGGDPEKKKYRDYVDRGCFSVETVITLFCLKINFPKTIIMLRGNHECRQLTSFFNFKAEVIHKYDEYVYKHFMECFDTLPLACVLNERFLAIHAGISPGLKSVTDITIKSAQFVNFYNYIYIILIIQFFPYCIKNINRGILSTLFGNMISRFQEPPREGAFCDFLWSDPIDNEAGVSDAKFVFNTVRGCSYFYSKEGVTKFLEDNQLLSVIRGHEAQLDGYKMHRWNGKDQFPCVITLFSAPNYCDCYRNKGAVIKFSDNILNIQQFVSSPHPYLLPNFMDLFSWSIPFLCEKVTEMSFHLLKPKSATATSISDEEAKKAVSMTKKSDHSTILKKKIRALGKMSKLFRILRQENESILKLKNLREDHMLPKGVLEDGPEAIKLQLKEFEDARKSDLINERRPDKS